MSDVVDVLSTHVPVSTWRVGGWAWLECAGCDWGKDVEISALDYTPHRLHVAALIESQVRAQITADIIATRDRHVGSLPLGTTTAPADRWALTYDYAARIARGEA